MVMNVMWNMMMHKLQLFVGIMALLSSFVVDVVVDANSGSSGVFSIYQLPPFSVTIKATTSPTDVQVLASQLRSITQTYLREYYEATIAKSYSSTTSSSLLELNSIELQVSLRQLDDTTTYSEMFGSVALNEPDDAGGDKSRSSGASTGTSTSNRPTPETVHSLLSDILHGAFEVTSALPLYRQRLLASGSSTTTTTNAATLYLQSLQYLTIDFDVDPGLAPPIRIDPSSGNASATSTNWSSAEFILLGTLIFFLASAAAALYVFIHAERYKYHHDRHYNAGGAAAAANYYHGRDGPSFTMPTIALSSSSSVTSMTTTKTDTERNADREVWDQYPDAHADIEGQGQSNGYNGGRPLMTLPEETSIVNWVKNISSHLFPSTSLSSSSSSSSAGQQQLDMNSLQQQQQQKDGKDKIVFKDFPRHDGTPCLLYNPNAPTLSRKEQQHRSILIEMGESIHPTTTTTTTTTTSALALDGGPVLPDHSQHSISSTGSLEVFIDRLENLYELKKRQYEQRKEMEEERQRRKLQRQQNHQQQQQQRRSNNTQEGGPTTTATTTTTAPSLKPIQTNTMTLSNGSTTNIVSPDQYHHHPSSTTTTSFSSNNSPMTFMTDIGGATTTRTGRGRVITDDDDNEGNEKVRMGIMA